MPTTHPTTSPLHYSTTFTQRGAHEKHAGCRTSIFGSKIAVTKCQNKAKSGDISLEIELRHPSEREVPKLGPEVPNFDCLGGRAG